MATSVRFSEFQNQKLLELGIKFKKSQSQIIKEAVDNYLEDLEDLFMAQESLKEYLESGKKGKSSKELFKELNL